MTLHFQLYIAGEHHHNHVAISNLQNLNKLYCQNQAKIEIIDLTKSPEVAIKARVVATPTLVKVKPSPVQRVIGDLSDIEKVATGLGLRGMINNVTKR
ncbi:MAG TPA: circadian clock KaiB family protein [Anaerolineae bacterium]|nr:circadian clock protein KaiB [Anaerolineae bacterium]MCB0179007.1 circadian clock protein KaiB [Anaerolineae bacterium]MCB0225023.1 circadian clock protein KaiB [Anaerolineae bacterium]MCB9103447.1 circadian clock protein KaiB [Anaerolineales bacterium]HRV91972.1 circadian clock KaiB family protein [Anaerolineae bacterium]